MGVPLSARRYLSYLPIPTSHSRTIKLNGRPNNHIITYAIRYLLY